jgi:hypothetical protein
MRTHTASWQRVRRVLLALFISVAGSAALTACSQAGPPAASTADNGDTASTGNPSAAAPASAGPDGKTTALPVGASPADLQNYSVRVLAIPHNLTIPGTPGELSVWIGDSVYLPAAPSSASYKVAPLLGARSGQSAKVTPFAPGIKVDPQSGACQQVVPTGTEDLFTLTPTHSGTFRVGASVLLYDSPDCTGTPVPKSATAISVQVSVNTIDVAKGGLLQLWKPLWSNFLTFWGTLVAIVFALILFLLRKKLYKWFGFGDKQ